MIGRRARAAATVAFWVLFDVGMIVLLGYVTNVLVASLTAAALIGIVLGTLAAERLEVPRGQRHARFPIDVPSPIDDDVQFSVYRPALVRPAQWYPLLAFAHKTTPFPGPDARMINPIALVEQQAQELIRK